MKSLYLFIFLLLSITTFGQTSEPRFHIGLSAGLSKVLGTSPKIKSGLNLNFVNAGYSIGKGFGVTGKWIGGKHETNVSFGDPATNYVIPAKQQNRYQAIMIGPMYSIAIGKVLILDIKTLLGRFSSKEEYTDTIFNVSAKSFSIGYSVGLSLRYNITHQLYLNAQSDYMTGDGASALNDDEKLKILNLNVGLGIRF